MSDLGASMSTVTSIDQRLAEDVHPAASDVRPAVGTGAWAPRLGAFARARVGGLPRPFWVL